MFDYLRHLPTRIAVIVSVVMAWCVAYFGAPIWVVLALSVDLVRDRRRMQWLRVYGFALGLLTNEVVGLIALFGLWVAGGFGIFLRNPRMQKLNGTLQGWWAGNIMKMVCFFMDTKLAVSGDDALLPSPALVLSRHISFLDAAIPAVLITGAEPNTPRHVFMRELRFDPCIEISARRSPNHMVDRSGGAKELKAIEHLGTTLGAHKSGVIFPEGGFRTEKRFQRAVASLERRFPNLSAQAVMFRHVMPPRPGGTYAFLSGAPADCDVAVIAHAGFDSVSSVGDIIRGCPLSRPVLVQVRRIPRNEVPTEESEFGDWLFAQFRWIDDYADGYDRVVCSATGTQNVTGIQNEVRPLP